MKKSLSLSKAYRLLEPGPVVLVTSASKGKANIMAMSWHMMIEFEPPLIHECYANLECKVVDMRMAAKYNVFILEVLKAWFDPSKKNPRTIHHCGKGVFMVAGRTITLPSKMK